MVYILVFIGVLLILIGVYMEKNMGVDSRTEKISTFSDNQSNFAEIQELSDIKLRIKNLENIVFNISYSDEYEEVVYKFDSIEEKSNSSTNLVKTFEMLCKYEKEGNSLEEICELLNMNKGEVLLLKNLYKNYQG